MRTDLGRALRLGALLAFTGFTSLNVGAQAPTRAPGSSSTAAAAAQPEDADFAARVREWTTKPEFLTPLVDRLPLAPGIPTPKDVLGYHVGVPNRLTGT